MGEKKMNSSISSKSMRQKEFYLNSRILLSKRHREEISRSSKLQQAFIWKPCPISQGQAWLDNTQHRKVSSLVTSFTNMAWKPYGTLAGSSMTATGSDDIDLASITTTSDFLSYDKTRHQRVINYSLTTKPTWMENMANSQATGFPYPMEDFQTLQI